jgi:hypothetical protein
MGTLMKASAPVGRVVVLIAVAILAGACGTSGNHAPTGTPTTPTTMTTTPTTMTPSTTVPPPPAPPPTEKSISPSSGNLFSPTVLAPAAPTELPGGRHRH